jgi:hypothetical protein
MRIALTAAIAAACFCAGPLRAEDPKLPASASQPTVVLASASEADGKVSIRLRLVEAVPAAETKKITVYESVSKLVDGNVVTEKVPVEKTITIMVMKPARWREVKLTLGDPGVEVRDLAGKEIPAKKLASLLEKEIAVLLSTAGPVDPFHLQLAKEGTLVVIAPQEKAMLGPIGLTPGGPPGLTVPGLPGVVPGPLAPPAPPAVPRPPLPPKDPPKQ